MVTSVVEACPNASHPVGRVLSPGVAWQLTQAMSPRTDVRVMTREASGALALAAGFVGRHDIDGLRPEVPWAVSLFDDSGRAHLLCFDLDAHTPDKTAQVKTDLDTLLELLRTARIRSVVTASSGRSDGGRHVWVALTDGIDATLVATLARAVRQLCPTLDVAPLSNSKTGCVRPPGAPHKLGRTATVLQGRLSSLAHAETRPDQIGALVELVKVRVAELPAIRRGEADVLAGLPRDTAGHPYLEGPRGALTATTLEALAQTVGADGSTSSALWRVLIGAAFARWRYADLTELAHQPAFEHVRTLHDGRTRRRRPAAGPGSPTAILTRQWERAVAWVASLSRGSVDQLWGHANQIVAHLARDRKSVV